MPDQLNVVVPALIVIGAFYAFAGFVAVRAVLKARFFDLAIAAISLEKLDRREVQQQLWLLTAALSILAGGLALLLRLEFAALLFLVSAILQGIYLTIAAPYYFDLGEPVTAGGRQATKNAAILYAAAAAFVCWGYVRGYLFPVSGIDPLMVAIGATVWIAVAVHALWTYARDFNSSGRQPEDGRESSHD